MNNIIMGILTKVNLRQVKLMEREFILGRMVKFTTVSGKQALSMEMGCGKEFMETRT